MKKILYFFILLLIPFGVKAYGIENYRMDVTVLENGDLNVIEMFELTGSFNGMERIINYRSNYSSIYGNSLSSTGNSLIYNGTGLELKKILGVDFSSTADLKTITGDIFNKVSSASKGDYGVYTVTSDYDGYSYLIYNPNRKRKAFYLEYTLKDMAITHNDLTEVGWNIFTSMNESIGNLEIYIHIPNNKEMLRVWAHGPLWGESKIIDKNTLYINIKALDANEAIDVRFVFDKILTTAKKTNLNVLDRIVEIETDLANKANLEREQKYRTIQREAKTKVDLAEEHLERNYYESATDLVSILKEDDSLKKELSDRLAIVLTKIEEKERNFKILNYSISAAYLVGLIFLTTRTYIKYDKEYEKEFTGEYFRDFPANYPPSTVGYLMRRKVTTDDLSAGIMDLIRKKAIKYQQLDDKGKDFSFERGEAIELSNEEQKIMKFLFKNDTTNTITLKELKKSASSGYSSFISRYEDWKLIATAKAKAEDFYENVSTAKTIGILYTIAGFIYGAILFDKMNLGVILAIVSLIFMMYFSMFTKKTKKGNEQYNKWKGLKKFMEDFGTMDTKDLPQIELWDKYLVYAITLGCADKLSKVMQIKVQEMGDPYTTYNTYDLHYINSMTRLNRMINSAVTSSMNSAYSARSAATASSSSSSGGGFGGGFSGGSGGGGSFGGGGGGGRF